MTPRVPLAGLVSALEGHRTGPMLSCLVDHDAVNAEFARLGDEADVETVGVVGTAAPDLAVVTSCVLHAEGTTCSA